MLWVRSSWRIRDYFEPNGGDYQTYCGRSGNRTWTLMVYLNVPRDGGATRFIEVDKMFKPGDGQAGGRGTTACRTAASTTRHSTTG